MVESSLISRLLPPSGVIAALILLHVIFSPVGEPFKNGDETRHVMTGVFFRDSLADWRASSADPRGYAVGYYLQYPALGLLVWPPFFHCVEGVAMWLFGTSYLVGRLTLGGFAAVGAVYAYALYRRTHDRFTSAVALAVLGASPIVFDFTGSVLLEVPTLAMVLGAVFHFEKYLGGLRGRDAIFACAFAALAVLTRFDGILLIPFVLLRLGFARRWGLLLRRPVVFGIAGAILLTAPYYFLTWKVYGSGIQHAAVHGTGEGSTSLFDPRNLYLYPSYIPAQIGWAATLAAAVGLCHILARDRTRFGPHFPLIVATFLTFAPLAEPESRHAIYWMPALSLLAVHGVRWAASRVGRVEFSVCILLVIAVVGESIAPFRWTEWRNHYICGTEDAARYVLPRTPPERPLMYEGQLNGAFIYAVRRNDPHRQHTVLRADKIIYSVFSDPHGGYDEYAKSDRDILDLLHRYDPAYVIVEEPQVFIRTAAGERLRRVLREHPEEYVLEGVVPFRTNYVSFAEAHIAIYRKVTANPDRVRVEELPVLLIGGSVKTK